MELSFISFLGSLWVILKSVQAQRSCIMDEYEDVENDVPDAYDTTTEGQEHGASYQNLQNARQLGLEAERSQLANLGVLKATNGNAAKRLKTQHREILSRPNPLSWSGFHLIHPNPLWSAPDPPPSAPTGSGFALIQERASVRILIFS